MVFAGVLPLTRADEGFWFPLLLDETVISRMQEKGLRLTAEDIYSINHASLKDAVVIFGRGCTGGVISEQGLVITNHHCGLSYVQAHSTVEHDYLENGFWAGDRDQEIPCPDLSVSFLVKIEDVTDSVLVAAAGAINEDSRLRAVNERILEIEERAVRDNHYQADVKPFYYGKAYYLFLYELFGDVRLVAAPPSDIGNFGGNTDNWMWPRHTGDFSLFRIYADNNNRPAPYDLENVPYHPKKSLSLSLEGYVPRDFTMVMGYPGSTREYVTAAEMELETELAMPKKIRVRSARMEILDSVMKKDEALRIQYASRYAHVSNGWKKWIGMLRGLDRTGAVEVKRTREEKFRQWIASAPGLEAGYGGLLEKIRTLCDHLSHFVLPNEYYYEVVMAIELMDFISVFAVRMEMLRMADPGEAEREKLAARLRQLAGDFHDRYHEGTDREMFVRLLEIYRKDIEPEFHPPVFEYIDERFGGDIRKYAGRVFRKTVFLRPEKLTRVLERPDRHALRLLRKDPAYELYTGFRKIMTDVYLQYDLFREELDALNRLYLEGLKRMEKDRLFYPDANFTMRVAYGQVKGYSPADAVEYGHFTTLGGIMEKADPDVDHYTVPSKLQQLYRAKDYGRYAPDDTMRVCFIADNHTSGGNSGSPVLNAGGELIGLNFDRNWEGTMSDYRYDPRYCRNIMVDIRYVLFLIDKFAGASHLIDEMDLVYE